LFQNFKAKADDANSKGKKGASNSKGSEDSK
jgi:hypothetical protein